MHSGRLDWWRNGGAPWALTRARWLVRAGALLALSRTKRARQIAKDRKPTARLANRILGETARAILED